MVKKEVTMLIVLISALLVLDLFSARFFIEDKTTGVPSQRTLESKTLQKDVASGKDSDAKVYKYVNDKLKKYGYESAAGEETENQNNENANPIQDNQNANENANVEIDDDSGMPIIPPNESGEPAESVEGETLHFGMGSGVG